MRMELGSKDPLIKGSSKISLVRTEICQDNDGQFSNTAKVKPPRRELSTSFIAPDTRSSG